MSELSPQPAEAVVPPAPDALLDPPRVVRHAGELDLASSVEMLQAVRRALRDRPAGLVLDLSDVTFIDVAGLRAVISSRRMAAARGAGFELVRPSPAVRRLVELVGLSSTFGLSGDG